MSKYFKISGYFNLDSDGHDYFNNFIVSEEEFQSTIDISEDDVFLFDVKREDAMKAINSKENRINADFMITAVSDYLFTVQDSILEF